MWAADTYALVQAIKATGNREGIIQRWKSEVAEWADKNRADPDAQAVLAWLPAWQCRPFYTATELAPLFPALLTVIFPESPRMPPAKHPTRLAHELDYVGLPWLQNKHGEPKFYHPFTAELEHFYIVERLHFWQQQELTQEDFERAFAL